MARERLVVIGGDAAGMSAASQARKRRGPDDLEIVAFERGNFTSFSACGIPYWVAGTVTDRDQLIAREPETFRERYDIGVHLRHEVVAIDTAARTVTVADLDAGTERDEPYDQLMYATGAVPIRPDLPGLDAENVFGIQTLDDGQRLLDALVDWDTHRVVVIGSGYIGLEIAEAMVERGIAVSVLDRGDAPMRTLDPDMGEMVAHAMRGLGIDLHLGTDVTGVETDADGRVTAVACTDGTHPADAVILGMGVRPDVALADASGIPVGRAGGVDVDVQMRTPVDGVWAGGDCAQSVHRVTGNPVAIALGTIANKHGRVAGINLGGGYATFPGVLGTAVTKVCGTEVARTGLTEAQAALAGFEFVTAKVRSSTRAGYFPGARKLTVKVIAERRSGQLLGAQIVGEEGAAKRIDSFAVALWNEMTVDALLNVDLSYAPPFSPVWDPVLIGARKAWQAVEEDLAAPR